MKQRIITALILIPLAIGWLFYLPVEYFSLLATLLFFLAGREWGRFASPELATLFAVTYTVILIASYYFAPLQFILNGQLQPLIWGILLTAIVWWVGALAMIMRYPGHEAWWQKRKWIQWLFGLCTLLPFFWSLLVLRGYPFHHDPGAGSWVLLFVMSLVWVADTGAYFTGRAFGSRKLLPAVSPNKTIEGLLGGVGAATLLAVIVTINVHSSVKQSVAIIISSMLAVLASVLGDLTESLFKRVAGIKDSGSLLPGHGGVLDRIDSLTAALPVFVVSYLLIS
ncbi:phosphatidate cytidylyltransferase [Tolumonas auensis DSM 9187]|uniref:Phosphatidate cytidylyltransferase n=1 Tax=Tolumonas auensis (strain DSM 9187 / NBRC 110442 / TA 4) TaxID=595494 RepID=C4L859_TOLAT|nr:phosphatidate cytidylyltransferase [Tolumonas auensis]ACQ93705.1 phosphatidate cytidylyltransferase [Tolumonas auensis DSM 9187]